MVSPQDMHGFIKRAQVASGFRTMDEFAASLGLTKSSPSLWLSNKAYPDDENIRKMAALTGDDPDEMIAVREVLKVFKTFKRKGYKHEYLQRLIAA